MTERDDGKPSELLENAFAILRDLPEFAEDAISDGVLRQLLQQSGVKSLTEHDSSIFTLNKPDSYCCAVLGGCVEMHDAGGVIQQNAGSVIGVSALTDDRVLSFHLYEFMRFQNQQVQLCLSDLS